MASTNFGRNLNPYRKLRDPLGIKGARHSVVITNNPSSIDQNQQLLVRFPNLGSYDVIVPGTARLAFTISLTSTDDNRTVVQNLGRAVVKKTTIKISGNEVLSIDASVVSGLAIGFATLGKKIFKSATPKFDFAPYDIGMVVLDIGLAMATKDMLVKQGILPADILK